MCWGKYMVKVINLLRINFSNRKVRITSLGWLRKLLYKIKIVWILLPVSENHPGCLSLTLASQLVEGCLETWMHCRGSGTTCFSHYPTKKETWKAKKTKDGHTLDNVIAPKSKCGFVVPLVFYFLPLSSRFTLFSCSLEMNMGPLNGFLWKLTLKLYERLLERRFRRTSFSSWFWKTHSAGSRSWLLLPQA